MNTLHDKTHRDAIKAAYQHSLSLHADAFDAATLNDWYRQLLHCDALAPVFSADTVVADHTDWFEGFVLDWNDAKSHLLDEGYDIAAELALDGLDVLVLARQNDDAIYAHRNGWFNRTGTTDYRLLLQPTA